MDVTITKQDVLDAIVFSARKKGLRVNRGLSLPKNPKVYRDFDLGYYGRADLILTGRLASNEAAAFVYQFVEGTASASSISPILERIAAVYHKSDDPIPVIRGFLLCSELAENFVGWLKPHINFLRYSFDPCVGVTFHEPEFLQYNPSNSTAGIEDLEFPKLMPGQKVEKK